MGTQKADARVERGADPAGLTTALPAPCRLCAVATSSVATECSGKAVGESVSLLDGRDLQEHHQARFVPVLPYDLNVGTRHHDGSNLRSVSTAQCLGLRRCKPRHRVELVDPSCNGDERAVSRILALAPLGEQVQPFGHSDEIAAGSFAKVAQLGGPSHVTVAALRSSLGGFVPRVDERPHLSFVSRGERLGGRTVV